MGIKIGIDISVMAPPRTGIGNYTFNIVTNLLNFNKNGKNHFYYLLSSRNFESSFKEETEHYKFYKIRLPNLIRPILWYEFMLDFFIKKFNIDIFFSPNFFLPRNIKIPSMVTIHDLIPYINPEVHTFKTKLLFKLYFKNSLRKAKHIITMSEATKKDLISIFNVNESKITVIYPGVNTKKFKKIENSKLLESIKEKYQLPDKYILYVGTLEPRKNLERLIKAFLYLKEKGIPHKLILVGKKGWKIEKILTLIKHNKDIKWLKYVPEEDLPCIYNLAEIFVYPSLYEGFGLPPLEAMACGVPTIVSNISSLPEVVGNAGILVNPYDIKDISKTILNLINNPTLIEELKLAGIERAKQFSWNKSAKKHFNILRELGNI